MDLRIALRLNHIPHLYLSTLNTQLPFSTLQGTTSVNLAETHYFARIHNTPSPHKCVYYLDANHLYGYLPLKNCSTIPIHEPAAKYDLTLTYFTHDTYSKRTNIKLVLPTDFSLQPNEINYFSFKIPLPDDCYRIAPTSILRPKAKWQTNSYTLVSLNLYPQKNNPLLPSKKRIFPLQLNIVRFATSFSPYKQRAYTAWYTLFLSCSIILSSCYHRHREVRGRVHIGPFRICD